MKKSPKNKRSLCIKSGSLLFFTIFLIAGKSLERLFLLLLSLTGRHVEGLTRC